LKAQKQTIIDSQTEIDQIDLDIASKRRDIEKRYEGTGATRGKVNAIIADETQDLNDMRSSLTIKAN
jgi:hypothetical protein